MVLNSVACHGIFSFEGEWWDLVAEGTMVLAFVCIVMIAGYVPTQYVVLPLLSVGGVWNLSYPLTLT